MRRPLCIVLLALPWAAWAQTPLTEAEALHLGLSRTALAELARGTAEAAAADVLAAGQVPNPTLDLSRDQTRGSPGSVEHGMQIAQTFDTSGRRALRRDAAVRRAQVVAAGNVAQRAEVAAEIRRQFYAVLLKQEVVRVTGSWTQRFARVEAIVQKLARAGDVSGYDRRRLTREQDAAMARLAVEHADLDRAQERLAALIGASGRGAVVGVLLPASAPPLAAALARLDERPALRVLAGRAEAADLDGRAAARGGVPDVTVGIGPKWIDNGVTRENGILLTLSVPLPLFDRGQAGQQRAEYRLARDRAEGEVRGLHRQVERLTAAAQTYRERVLAATPELLRIAEAAYRGGESTILELLDAYRGALEAEMTALDLEWKARAARIEYDRQTGSGTE